MPPDGRPDPDAILKGMKDQQNKAGRLRIYLGYAAGVGKTYAMLDDAREEYQRGADVLAGYIEPHTRPETMRLMEGLPTLPPKVIPYRNMELKEFDLDAALRRKPGLILVDELAHTNAQGVRNKKRYQDVEELLAAGIDVYATVNVQHFESLNDVVENITRVKVQETVPDEIFARADEVRLIDIEPEDLLLRFESGKVYRPEQAQAAMRNFFMKENLRLLREQALRKAADRLSSANLREPVLSEKMAGLKFLACIGPSPSSEKCVRWTARAAEAFHAPWEAVYVERIDSESLSPDQKKAIRAHMDLAERLGAQVTTLTGHDVAAAVSEYARLSGATNIVIGKSRNKKTLRNLFDMALEDKLISLLPGIEVHIIPDRSARRDYRKPPGAWRPADFKLSLAGSLAALAFTAAATGVCLVLRSLGMGDQNIIMVYLLSVLIVSRVTSGYAYGVAASILSVLAFNFFFTEPLYTFSAIQPGYPVTFLIMLLVAITTSALTVRIKTQALLAVARERRTGLLYEINKQLLATRGLDNIVALLSGFIVRIFGRAVIFYAGDPEAAGGTLTGAPNDSGEFMHAPDERAVARWVYLNQKRAGAGTDTLMGAGALYMPVLSQGRVLAVWGISCATGGMDHDVRLFLRMIASQAAMALERQRLSDAQRAAAARAVEYQPDDQNASNAKGES